MEDASWNAGRVNQAAVDSVRIYFDQKTPANPSKGIYQMDVDAFGNPPDVDGDPRIIILMLDIKDGYSGSGGYAVGYFYSFNEISKSTSGYATSNEAEIYFLDTYPLNLKDNSGLQEGLSTTAHEFQHMIHFNYNTNRITFLNEGCSLVAEVNCGYPIFDQNEYVNETNYYLLGWRNNDLVNILHDYARAARFFVYIRDQVGMEVFKPMVASANSNELSIDDGLSAIGSSLRFNTLIPNWFIANILNDTSVNPLYGYRYPHLPKATSTTYYVPNISDTNLSVERYGVQYYSFLGGLQLKATFASTSTRLVVKAIEVDSNGNRIVDVPTNTEFSEPSFGTTYTQIHFVVMNMDGNNSAPYSYKTSGSDGVSATTLSYASSPQYYIVLPSVNQKFAVRFTPTASGQLNSVAVALNGGSDAIQGNGNLLVSAFQNTQGSTAGVPGAQIGTNVSIPFDRLTNGWNTINMRSANALVSQGTDFHVVVAVAGNLGDTLQFLLDNGTTSPSTRTSSYRNGAWYNRADLNYANDLKNLLLTATIISETTDTIAHDTYRQYNVSHIIR